MILDAQLSRIDKGNGYCVEYLLSPQVYLLQPEHSIIASCLNLLYSLLKFLHLLENVLNINVAV